MCMFYEMLKCPLTFSSAKFSNDFIKVQMLQSIFVFFCCTGGDAVPEIFPQDESKQYDEFDHVVAIIVRWFSNNGRHRLFSTS